MSSYNDEVKQWQTGQIGLLIFLATVVMLFAGFTSSILVRRTGADWHPIPLPSQLWFNTILLFTSSITLELVRKAVKQTSLAKVKNWLIATVVLGSLFVGGQLMVWQQLRLGGIYLSVNPHSSFFYILTGVHAIHLLGGLMVLAYLCVKLLIRNDTQVTQTTINLCATYWHFLALLWLYLFVVLFVL
jgi:cytochrome c oxidase subunit 3